MSEADSKSAETPPADTGAAAADSVVAQWWVVRPRIWAALALLGVIYVILSVSSLLDKSVTVDEFGHLPVGCNVLRTGDFRYCQLNPPLMNVLSALPVVLMGPERSAAPRPGQFARFEPGFKFWHNGYAFMFDHRDDYHRLFVAARCVTVVLVGLLGLLLFFWARMLTPRRADFAGLAAAGLVWFSPNVLAHGRLVTTDAGAACFIALAVWSFHLFLQRPNGRRAIASGVALGLAQLVKFTAIYLYPVCIVIAVIWKLRHREARSGRLAKGSAVLIVVSIATLNAGYLFQGSTATWGSHTFVSDAAKRVQQVLPRSLPVLLPKEYVAAFDRQLRDVKLGDPSYLLGESYEGGRWHYFAVLIASKTPIPLLLLGFLAVGLAVFRRAARVSDSVLLLLPPAVFLVMFSFFSNKQLGLRMILPAFPLVVLWIVITVARADWKRWGVWPVAGLLIWFASETLWAHPNYLPYFNELAGGPSSGRRVALDSNLDWGQDLPKLKRYMENHDIERIQLLYFGRVDPAIYGIRYEVNPPARVHAGYLAVSVSLYGRWYALYDHGWVKDRLLDGPIDPAPWGEPVARIGHSIDVYRVPLR